MFVLGSPGSLPDEDAEALGAHRRISCYSAYRLPHHRDTREIRAHARDLGVQISRNKAPTGTDLVQPCLEGDRLNVSGEPSKALYCEHIGPLSRWGLCW